MLEKNTKISVLRKMIGLGEEIEPQFIVPQNSVSNLRNKMGLTERNTKTDGPADPSSLIPLENTLQDAQPTTVKCPHCENMATNFLYLERLIRSNYNPKTQCSLCCSSLKYLQYVNKSILQVFSNFDSIAQAAKTYALPIKRKSHAHDAGDPKSPGRKSKVAKTGDKPGSKHRIGKKPRTIKLPAKASKHATATAAAAAAISTKSASNTQLTGETKSPKARSRHTLKKPTKKAKASRISIRTAPPEDTSAKVLKPKRSKALRSKSNIALRIKQKKTKEKRIKVTLPRL